MRAALLLASVFSLCTIGCSEPAPQDPCSADENCGGCPVEAPDAFCRVDGVCDCREPSGGAGGAGGNSGTGGTSSPCPGAGILDGIAQDENGVAIEGMRVFAGYPPTGPLTSSFSGDTMVGGGYSISVDRGLEYRVSAQVVVDTRYMTAEGTETVFVACDEPGSYTVDATRGYFLDATLAGDPPDPVGRGEQVQLTLRYTVWNRALCEGCSPRIIVGTDGIYGNIIELGGGAVHPGLSGDVGVSLAAPDSPGTYSLYAILYPGSREDDASGAPQMFYESRYPDQLDLRYILLGELEVAE